MLDARQIRAARALLDWEQSDLARQSGLSVSTVSRMERHGVGSSSAENADRVERAFERAGVAFVGPAGAQIGVVLRVAA